MCLLLTLLLLGPRFLLVIYWIGWPARWNLAFDTAIFPILGIAIIPWTTLMYLLVAPDGVAGVDFLWLGLGLVVDIASMARQGAYAVGQERWAD